MSTDRLSIRRAIENWRRRIDSGWPLALAWVPLGALLAVLLLAASPWEARWQDSLDDAMMRWLLPPVPLDSVLVLDIDESSLQHLKPHLGGWPYRRDVYALVIDYLRDAGVQAVAIDIVLADAREGDAALRRSLQASGAPVVLAAAAWRLPEAADAGTRAPVRSAVLALPAHAPATHWPALVGPTEALAAGRVGMISTPLDTDGVLRRLPLLNEAAGQRVAALPVALALAQAGDAPLLYDGLRRSFRVGTWQWPTDAVGRARLPPPPAADALPGLPFHVVADAALGLPSDPSLQRRLAGRTVFIGSSAGLGDQVMTPSGLRHGTEWLAAAHAALTQGRVLGSAPVWAGLLLLLLALVPALGLWRRGRPAPSRDALATLVATALVLGAAGGLLAFERHTLLPLPVPLAALAAGWVLALVAQQRHMRLANARLDQERQVAEAANAAKSDFLASMSHELRTPLNGVIGACQLLRDQGEDRQRREELAEIIGTSGNHLLSLIDDVLQLARIEAGVLEIRNEPFNLIDCVEAALATAAAPARNKGLQMAAVVDPQLPAWRVGDLVRLRQVLVNLMGNAVKFTLRGEVVLRVGPGASADELVFRVIDSGIGLDESARSLIFQPFRQADSTTARRFGGSGLGLTICRKVVLAMAGSIEVDSEPGRGTCFTVRLSLPASGASDPPTLLGHRVAYIEPHPACAEALGALLERMGCETLPCSTPEQLRAAFAGPHERGHDTWLLVATDSEAALDVLEAGADRINPERVIGMTNRPWFGAEQARERFRLPRSVIKPVLRSALVSRFGAITRLDGGERAAHDRPVGESAGSVLIVEDDPVNQAIVEAMLHQAGFHTQVAGDGHTALQLFSQGRFDVVLMDWQMPDMDGMEATRRLRAGDAGPRGRDVPVVALTANAFAEDRAACLAAGMNDFLSKPVVTEVLIEVVGRWALSTQPL